MRRYRMKYTPVFTANRLAYYDKCRYIDNQGSSRSSKTYSIMQLLSSIAQQEEGMISVVSHSLPHLKKGAMRDFLEIMQGAPGENDNDPWSGMGIYDEKKHNKTDNIYNFGKRSHIEFFGAENSAKVRGPKRRILFINEANLLSHETFLQLAMRTTGSIFIDYNPADIDSWVYGIRKLKGARNIHSTYKNNRGNLSQWQIEEIENLQFADENLWKVFGLGLRGVSTETIYTHWQEVDKFPENAIGIEYGLDFGYNHAACLTRSVAWDGCWYVEELLYEGGLTNTDLAFAIKALINGGSYDNATPRKRDARIWCDGSRPEAIEELRRNGLNALPADKSVYDGILAVKSKPLRITRRSTNLIKEIKSYKWMKNERTGIVTDQPVKFRDDAMDSMRYSIYSPLNNPKRKILAA